MPATRSPTIARRSDDIDAGISAARAADPDRLAFYRLLAANPALSSYRAKVVAIVIAGVAVPAFLLIFGIVLGAGRISALAVILMVAVFAALSAGAIIWALDRVLVPLDVAAEAFDELALGHSLARTDVPGSDNAAQILRGAQALVARIEKQALDAKQGSERDELTGLWNRRIGREKGQALIDRETRRGSAVRALLADVDGFSAFNAEHGTGHGDALLKAVGGRIGRLAGDEGVAVRWSGDSFLLLQAGAPDELVDAAEILGRPIVVKGSDAPLTMTFGVALTEERVPMDVLVGKAEAALALAQGGGS